jgi:hypothetical protein
MSCDYFIELVSTPPFTENIMNVILKAVFKWFSAFVFVFLAGIASRALWEVFMFGWNLL